MALKFVQAAVVELICDRCGKTHRTSFAVQDPRPYAGLPAGWAVMTATLRNVAGPDTELDRDWIQCDVCLLAAFEFMTAATRCQRCQHSIDEHRTPGSECVHRWAGADGDHFCPCTSFQGQVIP